MFGFVRHVCCRIICINCQFYTFKHIIWGKEVKERDVSETERFIKVGTATVVVI
jgi:hypothetical protein